jgi:hypothetical protein
MTTEQDEKKFELLKSADSAGVVFSNVVLGRGIVNYVVNITLAVNQWTPEVARDEKGNIIGMRVTDDLVVSSRLRLDLPCARQLRDSLIDLLDQHDKQQAELAALASTEKFGVAQPDAPDSSKLN